MLEITLTAREVAIITMALHVASDEWGDPSEWEAVKLHDAIIDAWVAQNPEHYDLPWLKPL